MSPLHCLRNHFLETLGGKVKRNLMHWRNGWCCDILSLLRPLKNKEIEGRVVLGVKSAKKKGWVEE